MSSIVSYTFADGADKALQLENQEWGRAMSIGSDWTRIRLGMMANLIPDGTSNIATASIRMGFTQAADKHVGSGTGKLWYGVIWGHAAAPPNLSGATFTYNAGSGNPYFTFAGYSVGKQADTTFSGTGNGTTRHIWTDNGSTLRRAIFFVELLKSGTDMIIRGHSMITSSLNNVDHTLAQFRAAIADPTTGNMTINGTTHGIISPNTQANYPTDAGTYGEIIAPHIGWNKGLITFLNIYAIEVYRLA